MRAFVLAVSALVFALAPDVDARVIRRPSVAGECQRAPSWQRMSTCLAKFGKVNVLRTQGNAKLVQMTDDEGGTGWRVPGVYLFIEGGGNWRLGGMVEGDALHVTSFAPASAGKFTGYRIDISVAHSFEMTIAQRQRPVVHRQTFSTFCPGSNAFCVSVSTACDVYVDGKSYWTFRGTLELLDRVARVHGDQSAAGDMCAQAPEVTLPIPVEPFLQ